MSFILDALKKSEIERQRQSVPGLVDTRVPTPRQRLPAWAVALGILLAVNLVILIVVLARGWFTDSSASAPRTAAAAAPADLPAPASPSGSPAQSGVPLHTEANAHFSPMDPPPEYAPEIPMVGNSDGGAIEAPAAPRSTSGSSERSASRTTHRRDPLLTDIDKGGDAKPNEPTADDYKANEDEVLPTINEISLSGAQALPELHLDVHVFATKPADRFVYVNMRKYHEGATLQEGPTIERIRRDGVILDYQGLRFLLPRQ